MGRGKRARALGVDATVNIFMQTIEYKTQNAFSKRGTKTPEHSNFFTTTTSLFSNQTEVA